MSLRAQYARKETIPGTPPPKGSSGPTLPNFAVADPLSTGQVMQFRAVPALAADPSTPPAFLQLPAITPLYNATGDAHPMHVHEVVFEVVSRQPIVACAPSSTRPASSSGTATSSSTRTTR